MAASDRALSLLEKSPDRRPLPAASLPPGPLLESLGPQGAVGGEMPFSDFVPGHQERAVELAAELMDLANREGLDAAVARAETAAAEVSVELAQHALMLFITHHPLGQTLPVPSLEERLPDRVAPSRPPEAPAGLEALGAAGQEAALDWYREDARANSHHERWHVVYPFGGVPNPTNPFGPRAPKDRQGELFGYMHEQMLARYDAERLAVGLGAVEPLFDFTAPLAEAYDPGLQDFDARQASALMSESTQFDPAQLAIWDSRLFGDVVKPGATFTMPPGAPAVVATPDLIGSTVERNVGGVNPQRYGNLHNMGHVTIGFIPDPASPGPQKGGVMLSTEVAIRDPIFYRWHRHVDDLVFEWQERQGDQSFADAPAVAMRGSLVDGDTTHDGTSPDIAVVLDGDIAGDPAVFGLASFGGANWSKDPSTIAGATDRLTTTMRARTIAGQSLTFLDHPDFHFFLRADNRAQAAVTVTVRIFLAPVAWVEKRRQWIELDKFQQLLTPGRNVVVRSSKLASVARKPASRPGDPPPPPEAGADPNYCDCGWPYHLLLPRGTQTGMAFRLLVVLTDWSLDRVDVEGKCGSMSFCGKRDVPYPDKRPMGYPFDRPWPGGDMAKVVRETRSMAARDITIFSVSA